MALRDNPKHYLFFEETPNQSAADSDLRAIAYRTFDVYDKYIKPHCDEPIWFVNQEPNDDVSYYQRHGWGKAGERLKSILENSYGYRIGEWTPEVAEKGAPPPAHVVKFYAHLLAAYSSKKGLREAILQETAEFQDHMRRVKEFHGGNFVPCNLEYQLQQLVTAARQDAKAKKEHDLKKIYELEGSEQAAAMNEMESEIEGLGI